MKHLLRLLLLLASLTTARAATVANPFTTNSSSQNFNQLNTVHNWGEAASRTPPMGWNSWAQSGVNGSTEQNITNAVNAYVANSLLQYGWQYIVIDDGWQDTNNTFGTGIGRNLDGTIRANPLRFPSGITNVIAYIHSKGLKAGMYLEAGNFTSATDAGGAHVFPGSQITNGFLDGQALASWGVEYVRYSVAVYDSHTNDNVLISFIKGLQDSQRPVVVEGIVGVDTSTGGAGTLFWNSWNWDLFGIYIGGVHRNWQFDGSESYSDVLVYLDTIESMTQWSVPGKFEGGYFYRPGQLTYEEGRTLLSLFSIFNISAMGSDTTATPFTTNKNAFQILSDPLGIPGYSLSKSNNNTADVYVKPLGQKLGGEFAVALMNRLTGAVQNVTLNLTNIIGCTNIVTVFDCWSNSWLRAYTNQITMSVPAHGCELLRLRPGIYSPLVVPNSYYLSDLPWLGTATNNIATQIFRDRTVDNNNPGVVSINNQTYAKCLAGVGDAIVEFYTGGKVSTFSCVFGDDYANNSFAPCTNRLQVYVDDVLAYTGRTISNFTSQDFVSVDVSGAQKIKLRVTNPGLAGGSASNDRFVIADPLFYTSRGIEIEYLRTKDFTFNGGGFAPAATFSPAAPGPANSAFDEGFQLSAITDYQWVITVPNWVTLVTIQAPVQVLAANFAWTNSIYTRWNPLNADAQVQVGPYLVPAIVNNSVTSIVFSVPFPATNALKHIYWGSGTCSNVTATRNFGSPWKLTYQ